MEGPTGDQWREQTCGCPGLTPWFSLCRNQPRDLDATRPHIYLSKLNYFIQVYLRYKYQVDAHDHRRSSPTPGRHCTQAHIVSSVASGLSLPWWNVLRLVWDHNLRVYAILHDISSCLPRRVRRVLNVVMQGDVFTRKIHKIWLAVIYSWELVYVQHSSGWSKANYSFRDWKINSRTLWNRDEWVCSRVSVLSAGKLVNIAGWGGCYVNTR